MTDTNELEQEPRSGLSDLTVKLERVGIIKMATAAGFSHSPPPFKHWRGTISDLERFANLILNQRSNIGIQRAA